jgi:hypothetical protein
MSPSQTAACLLLSVTLALAQPPTPPDASAYPSIQAALDANLGRMVFVPPGDYRLTNALIIRANHSGLYGFGALIQSNTHAAFIELEGATNVTLRDLRLVRPAGRQECQAYAVRADRCGDLRLEGLRILENQAGRSAIHISDSADAIIQGCEVRNYKAVAIDDRTMHTDWGYAFRCLNGAGITVRHCQGVQILHNRILEDRLLPTRQVVQQFALGKVVARAADAQHPDAKAETVGGWHQGSAIEVLGPTVTRHVLVDGNFIRNAGQGIDAHADLVTISRNQIIVCHTGIKTMHGARNVLIVNNLVDRADDEGIYLGAGNAHRAEPARDGQPARPENTNRGCLVANNIIADLGRGLKAWALWKPGVSGNSPVGIKIAGLSRGQVLRDDLVISGNLIYDSGPDGLIEGGALISDRSPRFKYAAWIEPEAAAQMKYLRFSGNLFPPGELGVSNVELNP